MKKIFFLTIILPIAKIASGQTNQNEFNFLVKEIVAHQIPDSISGQMSTGNCQVTIFENSTVKRFKSGARFDQLCISSEEEIFLEDPKFYFEFKKFKIKSKRSSVSLVIMHRNPFKKVEVLKMKLSYEKLDGKWQKR